MKKHMVLTIIIAVVCLVMGSGLGFIIGTTLAIKSGINKTINNVASQAADSIIRKLEKN